MIVFALDRMIHLRRPQQRFQPAERYRVSENGTRFGLNFLSRSNANACEAIAAASDTFNRTTGSECDARTGRRKRLDGWTGSQVPKMPSGIRKTKAIPHLAGKGQESFLEEPQRNRYIQDAGLVKHFHCRAPGRKFPLEGMALR
jgi:hypothetical protein